jgi:predicted NBD/HSP70 family sugar kinase
VATAPTSGGDLSRLRQLNALGIVRLVRGHDPQTLTELSRATGLARASTEAVVRELADLGWLEAVPPKAGTTGRPARRYRFRADAGHVLGVDIGGHKVLALVADLDGEVRHSVRRKVDPSAGRTERLAAVDAIVAECLKGAGLDRTEIWATAAATTGLVDAAGQVVLSTDLPEWTGLDLAEHLGRLVGGAVLVENDSRLAALAETWRGTARHCRDMVYLLAGLRTGTGLIIDGRLHRGFGRAAGEIGALPELGWRNARDRLDAWDGAPAGTDRDDVPGHLFAAARAGDRRARAVVRRYAKDLALGAAALVLALDPQLVVLGGGFSRSSDVLLEPLRAELDKRCFRTPELRTSTLGDESVALGALRLALDHVDGQVFDVNGALPAPHAPLR